MNLKAVFFIIGFVFGTYGCSTIKTTVTSEPPGALIYSGAIKSSLQNTGEVTPLTFSATKVAPYWNPWFFQLKKQGFHDSEIIFKNKETGDRKVHFVLKPLPVSEKERTKETKPHIGSVIQPITKTSVGNSPTMHSLGKYQLSLYSDGSGSFGLPKDLELLGNHWSFHVKSDEMTDKIKVTAYRMGQFDINGKKFSAPFGLYLDLAKSSNELICVLGHDFPGRTALIRVDKNNAVKTNNKGCVKLSKKLDVKFRSGQIAKVRGREWPDDFDKTFDVNLDGYSVLTDYLRSKR
jgi:hypothetical protein